MTRCKTCGGTYEPSGKDSVRYFHACPPLSDAEVAAALALPADPALWSKAQKAAVAAADRTRPNARDENITSTAPNDTSAPMKNAGAGVTTVP